MDKLDYEKVFKVLVEETSNYVVGNNLSAMVLGISGGIDSTVVAAICHEVSKNTGIPLIGRSLPIKNKDDEFDVSKLVGEAFCDEFGVSNLETGRLYTHILNYIKEAEGDLQTPIANGNIQARLRMIYLYNLASIHKGLVMSTDNQTEYQLGFWTIHGDVGDFNPLQDLWKTEVYGLANWIRDYYVMMNDGEDSDKMWALEASIALIPTDGLGISNSDLEQIGAKSYDEVDDILQSLLSGTETHLAERYSYCIINKVWNRHLASEFKRKKAPIYIPRNKYE